ncbi:hypothetical protein ABK040_006082 [Willaertia magna]
MRKLTVKNSSSLFRSLNNKKKTALLTTKTNNNNHSIFITNSNFIQQGFKSFSTSLIHQNIKEESTTTSTATTFSEEYQRSYYCGEISNDELLNKSVKLNGWIENIRIVGNDCVFLTIRDVSGVVQVILKEKYLLELAKDIKTESVVYIEGKVINRPTEMINLNMKTGKYEIEVNEMRILNKSKTLPLQLINAEEEIRLKYRYLDLRRRQLIENLQTRSKALSLVRKYFVEENNFLEIETPTLFKSTPEGAREFLVPTRQKGKFYALTQSPQQYKQLLMIGGLDRYIQIARCYRDESGRMDRQPEFTQIDLEMSFITPKDIYKTIENFLKLLWKEILNIDIQTPFIQMKYKDVMELYGSDKPDLRYEDLKFENVTSIFSNEDSGISTINQLVREGEKDGMVYALKVKQLGNLMSRKQIDTIVDKAKSIEKTRLMLTAKISGSNKFLDGKLTLNQQEALRNKLKLEDGDLLILSIDNDWDSVLKGLGRVREQCYKFMTEQGLYEFKTNEEKYRFLWVVDFPLFERNKDQHGQAHLHTSRGLSSMHHPFTSPHPEDINYLYSGNTKDILKVRGLHYDCVLNGVELGGGSIRIHQPEVQKFVLEKVLELGEERTMIRFGHLIEALSYGAPPHGGLALGFDRLVAMLCGDERAKTLRDVIAFPKSNVGNELMSQAPNEVEEEQLKELYIKVVDQ